MKKAWAPGFTIVELLIVVVVIAILAAITIVSYNGITNQAHDTAIKNDLAAVKKKLELHKAETGVYPYNINEITALMQGFKASRGSYATTGITDHNLIYCMNYVSPDPAVTNYAFVAYSKSGKKFRITKDGPVAEYTTNWTNQTVACQDAMPDYTNNYRGYAAEDTTTGPWRPWTGDN